MNTCTITDASYTFDVEKWTYFLTTFPELEEDLLGIHNPNLADDDISLEAGDLFDIEY